MVPEPVIKKLSEIARGDLADFKALLNICERVSACLAGETLDDLPAIIEEKEALIRKIQENSVRNAPLWARSEEGTGEDSALGELSRMLEEVRGTVEAIQSAEARIAETLTSRTNEVQMAMGSISRGGKALDAYKPIRSYAPRFIDKKE
jgi:hypothetical protein